MNFKDIVKSDIATVIMNVDEFAENHSVRYDGETYDDVPIVFQKVKQSDRPAISSDHMEGIYLVTAVAYVNVGNLGGIVPEQGKYIEINDGEALGKPFYVRYKVATSKCEFGLITLELGYYDE